MPPDCPNTVQLGVAQCPEPLDLVTPETAAEVAIAAAEAEAEAPETAQRLRNLEGMRDSYTSLANSVRGDSQQAADVLGGRLEAVQDAA